MMSDDDNVDGMMLRVGKIKQYKNCHDLTQSAKGYPISHSFNA